MTRPYAKYPDAVALVVDYLKPLAGAPVYSRVPSDYKGTAMVRVERIGGLLSTVVTDRPRISVEAWAPTEADAADLCELARSYTNVMAGTRGESVVYRVTEVSGPMWLPDSATGTPRYAYAIEFSTRALASA